MIGVSARPEPRRLPVSPSGLPVFLLWTQGAYYLATGLWPLISLESFERVTGPKTDDWLVTTVGVLVSVIAAVLLTAAWRRAVTWEIVVLAAGAALALTAIDVIFAARGVISRIYLADAAAEAGLVLAWTLAFAHRAGVLPRRLPPMPLGADNSSAP